jgi:Tol biopolymer transport system component
VAPFGSALYVQTESKGIYNLWKIRVDPNSLQWVSAERLTTGPGPDVSAAVSRDGTRLAFTTEDGSTRLWVFPLDPMARRLGSGKPLTEDDAMAKNATLSPDGQFVAYKLRRPGMDRDELWITNIAEGTSELVPTHGLCMCAWSPDGKAFAYTYLRLDSKPITARVAIRPSGGKERFISRWLSNMFFPSDWHAERGLVGSYGPYPGDTVSLALWPTGNPEADKPDRVLTSKPKTGLWQARFSPNGRWLSFVAVMGDSPSATEIDIAPADTSRPER